MDERQKIREAEREKKLQIEREQVLRAQKLIEEEEVLKKQRRIFEKQKVDATIIENEKIRLAKLEELRKQREAEHVIMQEYA